PFSPLSPSALRTFSFRRARSPIACAWRYIMEKLGSPYSLTISCGLRQQTKSCSISSRRGFLQIRHLVVCRTSSTSHDSVRLTETLSFFTLRLQGLATSAHFIFTEVQLQISIVETT